MAFPSEPPIQADDTQPRQPTQALVPDPSWSTPLDTRGLISPDDLPPTASRVSCFLGVLIVLASAVMCGFIVILSAVAGYRDELDAIQTEAARDVQATSEVQYQLAIENIANGQYEFAYERLRWVSTNQPNYLDVQAQMSQLEIILSYTPTPAATSTPSPTASPTATNTPDISPTPTVNEIELYFNRAESFFSFNRWEDTIAALDVVVSLDPTYRRSEVDQMLFTAYVRQSTIYFNGTNPIEEAGPNGFAGNQLARGLVLYQRAEAMIAEGKPVGTVNDLDSYTAFFVEGFVTARRYVEAGQNTLALPILQELCELNCVWGYRGLTVEQLLSQAQGG